MIRLLYLLLLTTPLIGQGVMFIDNDLTKAMDEAGKQEKIIFVDAYTTWCGPCKMMDRNTFSDPAVGAFFNENFVNLKLDMEKGDGIDFAHKYEVRAFPSFLFLNAEGAVLFRSMGYRPPANFLEVAHEAIMPDKHLAAMQEAYESGEMTPDALYRYSLSLLDLSDSKGREAGEAWLATQQTWSTPQGLRLVSRLVEQYDDPYYRYVVEKRHLFIREFGEQNVDGFLNQQITRHFFSQADRLSLSEVRKVYHGTFPSSKAGQLYDEFEMKHYEEIGDLEKYAQLAQAFMKKYPNLTWNRLNDIAWSFYELIDDPKALKQATKWALKSVKKDSNAFNNDTAAALYYKQGNKKQALKYAERAIALAKANSEDYSETAELLEKINAL